MTALVVHESHWGNTEAVARAVAAGLGGARVRPAEHATPEDLAGVDLLVVGGPTHAFSMSRPNTRHDARTRGASQGSEARGIREFVDSLPSALPMPVATFDTRATAVRHLPGSAARSAAKALRMSHRARVVGRASFYVEGMEGPLADGELDRARDWGRRLAASERFAPHDGRRRPV